MHGDVKDEIANLQEEIAELKSQLEEQGHIREQNTNLQLEIKQLKTKLDNSDKDPKQLEQSAEFKSQDEKVLDINL